jgi:hypothetical protein
MTLQTEISNIDRIADEHAYTRVSPEFSAPYARRIVNRCKALGIASPLVIRRFQDRAEGPQGPEGPRDKIARDFYGAEFQNLPDDKKNEVTEMRGRLANPATGHPYLRKGLTFIEARQLLVDTYRTESQNRYPQEIRTDLQDFRKGLENDLDDAAKARRILCGILEGNSGREDRSSGPAQSDPDNSDCGRE